MRARLEYVIPVGVLAGVGLLFVQALGQMGPPLVPIRASSVTHKVCHAAILTVVEKVVDGDTFDVRLEVPAWIGVRVNLEERVRLLGVDAWEMRDARGRGVPAQQFAAQWLKSRNFPTTVVGCKRDNFGRALVTIDSLGKGDLGAALVAAGHAVPWQP